MNKKAYFLVISFLWRLVYVKKQKIHNFEFIVHLASVFYFITQAIILNVQDQIVARKIFLEIQRHLGSFWQLQIQYE